VSSISATHTGAILTVSGGWGQWAAAGGGFPFHSRRLSFTLFCFCFFALLLLHTHTTHTSHIFTRFIVMCWHSVIYARHSKNICWKLA